MIIFESKHKRRPESQSLCVRTNIFVVEGVSDSDGTLMPVPQGSSADRSQWREPTRTSEGLCSLYEAALCLFEEVRIKTRHIPDLGVTFLLDLKPRTF